MAVTEKDDRLSFCLEAFSRLGGNQAVISSGKGEICVYCSPEAVPCVGHMGITRDRPSPLSYVFISPPVGQGWRLFPKLV